MTRAELRTLLIQIIGADLGQYARQEPLGPTPAIYVNDRPLPSSWKVIKAESLNAPLIPCFECAIEAEPIPSEIFRNVRHRGDWNIWQVHVVQHDRRQFFDGLKDRMHCNFRNLREPQYIPGTDLYNAQYLFQIPCPIIREVA